MEVNAAELMLDDLRSDYAEEPVPKRIARVYEDDPEWGHLFGVLHSQLNRHFESINGRINTNRHYWADPSRELLKLFSEIEQDLHTRLSQDAGGASAGAAVGSSPGQVLLSGVSRLCRVPPGRVGCQAASAAWPGSSVMVSPTCRAACSAAASAAFGEHRVGRGQRFQAHVAP